ncbi:MAG TPA: CHAD domain-containing protein [Micromonosporaceae bacterium]|jgi:CHAD domain-containing protein
MGNPDDATHDVVLAYLQSQRDALEAAFTSAYDGDEGGVHDMRVASRRLRSCLRTFRGLWDRSAVDAARAELKWLADRLGPVRDAQVMSARLDAAVRDEPPELVVGPIGDHLPRHFARDEAEAQGELRRSLASARYRSLLSMIAQLAVSPTRKRGPAWVAKRVRRDVHRAEAKLDEALAVDNDGRDSGDRDEHLHDARKAYKRGRYAVEVLRPAGGKPARRLVKRLKAAQDVLGAYQDSIITREVLYHVAEQEFREGGNTFTYGLLHARQASRGERSLSGVARASRRARRRKVRRWL